MQGPQLVFQPNPHTLYKVVCVLDHHKVIALQDNTNKLCLQDYHAQPNQVFNVYQQNGKYAFVNPEECAALHVQNQANNDGGVISADGGQHNSSWFSIEPVAKGEWAGKACHIKTFTPGKSFDIKGGKPNPNTEICQWKFHGGNNQAWLIIPADNLPKEKVEAVEQPEDVPEVLEAKPKHLYKIYSVQDQGMVLSVSKDNKMVIAKWNGDGSQKFHIHHEKGKYAFVVQSLNAGICLFQDKKDNAVQVITDAGKHESSWFEVSRMNQGKWAHKAYVIRTHAPNKVLDIAGGKAVDGKAVLQYNYHGGENQLFLFQQIVEAKEKKVRAYRGKDVAPQFVPNLKNYYKVLSILNKKMALTVNNKSVVVQKFQKGLDQKFILHQDGNRLALVNAASSLGLCVDQDKKDNCAAVVAHQGQHGSSWFEIVRADKGQYANKGYLIKTHTGNMALDIAGGQADDGKHILQYNIHQGGNQVWLIEPSGKIKTQAKNKETPSFDWKESFVDIPVPFGGNNQGNNMNFLPVAHFKPNQNYILYAVHSNNIKCLDIAQDPQNFGQLIIYSFHGAPNQRFTFEQEDSTHYRIRSVATGKYLSLNHDEPFDGIWARVDDKGNKRSEHWSIFPATEAQYAGKGAYHVMSAFNKSLQTPGGSLDNSTHVQQGSFFGAEGQTWVIKEI